MSDENENQESTKPEGTSGDDILESSAYEQKEKIIPVEGTQDARNKSSAESTQTDINFGKTNSNSPSKKKKRRFISYILVVLALLAVILVSTVAVFHGFGIEENLGSSQKVAVIYVQGTMLTGNVPAGLGYATSEEISENIRSALEDKNVKAIVLRINSAGGSPAAAQEIVSEIKRAQEHGVPVVVSMGDSAASAAYYISAPTNYIIANPSTITGSIGAVWVFQNMSSSYKKDGVDYQIVKSGELKDMGGTWRGLTDTEKEYAGAVVDEVYDEFVTEVSEGRKMNKSDVKAIADGRIYTGSRAKQLGLVDSLGDFYDAIDKAAKLGGITGEPKIVYMNKASLSKLILGSDSGQSSKTQQFVNYFEESLYGKILV
jgi:protease IV